MTLCGQRGGRFVTRGYSWDSVVDQTLDMYAKGIERVKGVRA
jgi:hypothetical protein